MPIKTATNYLAASNDVGREQTIKTNFGSSRATYSRTSNNYKNAVKGNGIAAAAVAVPVFRDGHKPKRAWCVLLDSGLDGDLIFIKTADVKVRNPIKRTHPLVWGTSNGDFKTTQTGNVDIKFTEFSRNKIFSVKPDIIVLDKNAPNPDFDMILGVDTLRKFWVMINFAEESSEKPFQTLTIW